VPPSAAQRAAELQRSRASALLIARGLLPLLRVDPVREDSVEHWKVRNSGHIRLPWSELPGEWFLHMSWLFRNTVAEPSVELVESSIGLNVEGHAITEGGPTSLVRYDEDRRPRDAGLASRRAHLNVLQPRPLSDKLHLPAFGIGEWKAEDVLDFLVSDELRCELGRRFGAS
jgi:hypothetical protein